MGWLFVIEAVVGLLFVMTAACALLGALWHEKRVFFFGFGLTIIGIALFIHGMSEVVK